MESNSPRSISPTRYGATSLIAACLAWASWPLVLVVGVFLAICWVLPLAIVAVAAGLLGIGLGAYRKEVASVMSAGGLALIGAGAWMVMNAMQF